ncbi:MAG: exodeoxyribonuclease VII large subunit [Coriobacteriia bacterium]|nr:exodeoxyribonuclease VII large subunit [Coriobacteriia bacterium]MCL2537579.1 exodeoxyribonuclease VII large subunit [Coriobacteriia bacterium]
MTAHGHTPPGSENQQPLAVTEALHIAKHALESMRLRVIGEVSGFTGNKYKVKYFSLKDSDSALKCTVWGNVYDASGVALEDGLEIEVEGRFSVYAKRGDMSFQVSKIHVAGQGQLRMELAAREARLRAEGLFEASRKKTLPQFPLKVAVVTSAAGAVIHDIQKTLARRWPVAEILLYGVRVEGEHAEAQIVAGLQAADRSDADVVIVARGGGSFEDLLPFSSEAVTRAIAAMNKPVVSGVGHEPDVSLADHAADLRAPTPTAAAEAVSTPGAEDLLAVMLASANSMDVLMSKKIRMLRASLDSLASRPVFSGPEALLQVRAMQLDSVQQRMCALMARGFERQSTSLTRCRERILRTGPAVTERRRARIEHSAAALDALSPLKVLGRGYAAVFDESTGAVLDSVKEAQRGQNIAVKLQDGQLDCEVKGVRDGTAL